MNASVFLSNLHHAYAQTDGSYAFPNSREGDMLKRAKCELEAYQRAFMPQSDGTHTPTPWTTQPQDEGREEWVIFHDSGAVARVYKGVLNPEADAKFIVTACNSHAANLARIAELEGALEKCADRLAWHQSSEWAIGEARLLLASIKQEDGK